MTSINKQIVAGGAWVLTGRLVSIPMTLAVNALVARLLAPQEMGAYFLIVSLVSIAAVVAQLGLKYTVVRLVARALTQKHPQQAARAVRLVLGLGALGASMVAAIVIAGGGNWLADKLSNAALLADVVLFVAVWIVVLTLQELLAESFRGFHDVRLATLFGGVLTSTVSALLFAGMWLVREDSNVHEVVVISVAAVILNITLGFPILRNKLVGLGTEDDLSPVEILRIAWPIWVTSLTLIALTQADLWIIGIFRSGDEVAIYGAALRFVTLVAMPLAIVNAVVPSFITKLHTEKRIHELEETLRSTTTWAAVPAFIVLGMFLVFAPQTLAIVYGDYYRAAATVLILLSIGQFVNVWAGSCGLVLIMTGHQTLMMSISVGCGLLNVVCALLVVNRYGAHGVAIVATATMLIQNSLMLTFSRLRAGVWTHARFPIRLPKQVFK